jgi:hypothetical protein
MSNVPFKYEIYFDKHERQPKNKHPHFSALANSLKGTIEASKWRGILTYPNGNIGIGYIITSSEVITLKVVSQNPNYLPNPLLKGLTSIQSHREACTEFRILNGLILGGDVNYNDKIFIDIYTENAPCDSCAEVIKQFLNAYPKSHIKVVYKLHTLGSNFCSWPTPLNNWPLNSFNRFSYKHVKNTKGTGLFEVGKWYVRIDNNSKALLGHYKFRGYSFDGKRSVWFDSSYIFYYDIDFIAGSTLYLSTRDNTNIRIPLGPTYIEQFF